MKHLRDGSTGVHRIAENIGQDLSLRKSAIIRPQPFARHDACDHFILILAIHDRKPLPETDALGVPAQDAIANGMERSAPNSLRALGQQ